MSFNLFFSYRSPRLLETNKWSYQINKDSQRQRRDTGDILFCCSCVIVALKYLDTCRLIISLPNHRHPDFTYTAKFNGIKVNVCLKVLWKSCYLSCWLNYTFQSQSFDPSQRASTDHVYLTIVLRCDFFQRLELFHFIKPPIRSGYGKSRQPNSQGSGGWRWWPDCLHSRRDRWTDTHCIGIVE